MKGKLFRTTDERLRKNLFERGGIPFSYDKTGKTVTVSKYVSIPEMSLDDLELLRALAEQAVAASKSA